MNLLMNGLLQGDGRFAKRTINVRSLELARRVLLCLLIWAVAAMATAQALSTTMVQGTVYLANGQPGAGTLVVSWPAFTTSAGQVIAADSTTVTIPSDGFVSLNLAPNVGAIPAGEYYTAVFYMSDGSTSTQYWVVPALAQATLAQVQAQVMPAAQAVQAVSKAYVDQSIDELTQSLLTASGGNLSGPLYLNGDPTQASQAADKHYVDTQVATALPLGGGILDGPFSATQIGAVYQADQYPGDDFGAKAQACLNALNTTYGGTCDARNFTGTQSMASSLTISTGNAVLLLPCATIATANQIIVTAGTRNVALRGCALRGGTAASGSQGGTVFAYSGTSAMVQVGDATYSMDTPGFHMDNAVINTTGATSSTEGIIAYRTQELDLESLYLLGNSNQTGMTLDGTGNYTGGTFLDDEINGFGTAVNAIGHQISNPATTDWMNASAFVRLHINCPTSNGNPIGGTYGINLQQGDGNTFTGGDIEGCSTALHLGPDAQNNTIIGLRNENSANQVVADAGSAYNNWITGGTMFTGKLTDNGTRNSFLDTFHRSFNGLNGDWYGSQQDATVTNHYRLGTGSGNERGLLNRYQTDYGYRWTAGLSDATAGEQFYQVLDELNNVYRLSIGQYNSGQSSTNNQTVINSAGTGAVVLNGSNNAGTGGVIIGSGGPGETTVATINNAGNAQFNGTLQVGGTAQSTGTITVRNNADAEVDYYLWPGLTASQKGSFTYKDWNGNSQWYMVKDTSNNWALNSAIGGLDSFKAYQSTNSGDTYINASNATGHIRLNYESGAGAETDIYSGSNSNLDAAFQGPTSIKFPGLAASSGRNCLQVDSSGYLTNTGSPCNSGSGGATGTINSGSSGQIAFYTANGTTVGGVSAVPVASGGTGAATAADALANLGAISTSGGAMSGPLTAPGFNGPLTGDLTSATSPWADIRKYGAAIDGQTDIGSAVAAATAAICPNGSTTGGASCTLLLPCTGKGCYLSNGANFPGASFSGVLKIQLQGTLKLGSTLVLPDNTSLIGDGGCNGAQFLNSGPTACVGGSSAHGTIGTATTATGGTPSTFTPTYASGYSTSNTPVNSVITVAGLETCPMSTSRNSAGTVTLTTTASCVDSSGNNVEMRIPVSAILAVSGCSDSSFNGTGLTVVSSDFPAGVMTVSTSDVTPATATGCSVSGFNLDSFESVRITGVSGSSLTASFSHPHGAADVWSSAAVTWAFGTFTHHEIQNINISSGGAALFADNVAEINLVNDGFAASPSSITAIPAEFDGTWWGQISNSTFLTYINHGCHTGCQQPTFPYGIRFSQDAGRNNGIGGGIMSLAHSTVDGGLLMDGNGMANSSGDQAMPDIKDIIIEHPLDAALMFDDRHPLTNPKVTADGIFLQDNFLGNAISYLGYTDAGSAGVTADLGNFIGGMSQPYANKYFNGTIKADFGSGTGWPVGRGVPPGIFWGNGAGSFEFMGQGAGLGPNVVPYATLPVTTSPTCTTCSAVLGPDGTIDGLAIAQTGSGPTNVTVGTFSGSTATGDRFLVWSWTQPGTGTNGARGGALGGNAPFNLYSYGTDSFSGGASSGVNASPSPFGIDMGGTQYAPQVALFTIANGESASHPIQFHLTSPQGSGSAANNFWGWGWMYIPAGANVSIAEVERWRQDLLHGCVPSGSGGFSDVGTAATCVPVAAPQFKVINPSTGADHALATTDLADVSTTAPADQQVLQFNAGTGKYQPSSFVAQFTPETLDFTTTTYPSGIGCSGTNPYTCTSFPTGSHICSVYVISGGAGGGAGAVESNTSNAYGGGGGAGAFVLQQTLPCSAFGAGSSASVTVTVGAGGAGGVAQSTSSSNGNSGSYGGVSTFAGGTGYVSMSTQGSGGLGPNPGSGGTTSSGSGGSNANSASTLGQCGGAAGSSGTGGSGTCFTNFAGPGGGAGGGGLASGTQAVGGTQTSTHNAQANITGSFGNYSGGSAGGGAGSTPTFAGSTTSINPVASLGGSGGGSNCSGNGGKGGNGMTPGGGGGGGGAACNGNSSGAGGKGGDGWVRVIVQ
jgi:Glycine-rich domain